MRILVTGSRGFAGKHLVNLLKKNKNEVFGIDIFPASNEPSELKVDLRDSQSVSEAVTQTAPDVIYHLAGIAFVPDALTHPSTLFDVHIQGTLHLLEACLHLPSLPRFIFISSAEVYGIAKEQELPFKENSDLRPSNLYALSKLMGEQLVQYYGNVHGIRWVVFRPFTHIGPGQSPTFAASGFARQLSRIALDKAPPVLFVGNLATKRDITDVRDIVSGYASVLSIASFPSGKIFNLCSGHTVSIGELSEKLIRISGFETEIKIDPSRLRKTDVPITSGSFKKAELELEWRPTIPLDQTLKDLYQYWISTQ